MISKEGIFLNHRFEKVPDKYKIALFVIVFISGITVFMVSIHIPQQARIRSLEDELAAAEKRIFVVENFALQNQDLQTHRNEIRQKLLLTEQLLPNEVKMGELLTELESIAKASKVQIGQVQPARPLQKSSYQETPVTMTVRGDYFMFYDFLYRIEGSKRFLAVSSLLIQSKTGDILEGKITLLVYNYGTSSASTIVR